MLVPTPSPAMVVTKKLRILLVPATALSNRRFFSVFFGRTRGIQARTYIRRIHRNEVENEKNDNGPGQGISTVSTTTDGFRVSPIGGHNIMTRKHPQWRPAKRWRDDLDKYWRDTIWQRTAQDRLTWRRHAEAFAQPRDPTLPNDDDEDEVE